MKKGYEKLQKFVLSQNKRWYSVHGTGYRRPGTSAVIGLATVTAHMLAIMGKPLTCNTGRGTTKRKSGEGTGSN